MTSLPGPSWTWLKSTPHCMPQAQHRSLDQAFSIEEAAMQRLEGQDHGQGDRSPQGRIHHESIILDGLPMLSWS